MKILFLTNLVPYPLNNGGKIKSYNTLKAISSRHEVDLVCFSDGFIQEKDLAIIRGMCRDVTVVPKRLVLAEHRYYMLYEAFRSLFSKLPYSVYKYRDSSMRKILCEKRDKNHYNIVYFDHLQLFVFADVFQESDYFILDEHNCESLLMKRKYEQCNDYLKKMFLKWEYMKYKKYEMKALYKSHRVIALSAEDEAQMLKLCPEKSKYEIIPAGIEDCGRLFMNSPDRAGFSVLFVGTLTWEANDRGILWYIKNVMPLLSAYRRSMKLYIIGKNPSKRLLEAAAVYSNIEVTGYVPDLDDFYNRCNYMIVPLLEGSGQRIKIIEAFSRGFPVISTTVGVEGLDYKNEENVLIADSPEEFVKAAEKMFNRELYEKISRNSRESYCQIYSSESISDKLLGVLRKDKG